VQPQYVAELTWNLTPQLDDTLFTLLEVAEKDPEIKKTLVETAVETDRDVISSRSTSVPTGASRPSLTIHGRCPW
jgi:hypothetical protein